MCLIISLTHHPNYVAKQAEENILVYKKLSHNLFERSITKTAYVTPIQKFPVIFKKGIAILSSEFSFEDFDEVKAGIHAYTFQTVAEMFHNAIIPKGARYFIGVHGDIVSTKLIIFEDNFVFDKWASKNRFLPCDLIKQIK